MFLQGSTLQDFNNSILGHLLFPEVALNLIKLPQKSKVS